jgi:hypothetical protein
MATASNFAGFPDLSLPLSKTLLCASVNEEKKNAEIRLKTGKQWAANV